jgi:hypothetical protein
VDEGYESDRFPLQDRSDDEHTLSAPSRPDDEKPFRPVSQMTAREWESAAREVQSRWPRQNRYTW